MAYRKRRTTKSKALVLRNDVCQSNPLVNARKVFDLLGMKIFFLGLSGLNPHFSERDKYFDEEFKELYIPTSKLTELFGGNTWYLGELKAACKKLFDTVIELNRESGGFTLMHLFKKLDYEPRDGLHLWFDDLMRPYILDLFQSKGYTKIDLKYLLSLSSPYAVRLLELLLQYQNIKAFKTLKEIRRKMTVEEVRFALNVPEEAYVDRMDNFRKYVLDDPIREIHRCTPYIVRYESVKQGRCVVAFDFTLDTYNVPAEEKTSSKPGFSNDAIEVLQSLGFSEKAARKIFSNCYSMEDCFSRINRAQALFYRQHEPVKNKLGFLRRAIEQDWQVHSLNSQESKAAVVPQITGISNQDVPPPSVPKDLKIGKKKMPYFMAKIYIEAIRKGHCIETVSDGLKDFDLTITEFETLCKKYNL